MSTHFIYYYMYVCVCEYDYMCKRRTPHYRCNIMRSFCFFTKTLYANYIILYLYLTCTGVCNMCEYRLCITLCTQRYIGTSIYVFYAVFIILLYIVYNRIYTRCSGHCDLTYIFHRQNVQLYCTFY